ncbi:hypothetical protein GCM10023191_051250 [Actinoallomurus oryzae]|uniref:Transposase n=1 Tax=Actinoallomurus oryzae TaxID=502180 RepID=A0ABP8QDJ9_9ACTN
MKACGLTSPTQRAGLPSKIDVQARVKRSADMHSPSLGHIAYQVNWKRREVGRRGLAVPAGACRTRRRTVRPPPADSVPPLIDAESGESMAVARVVVMVLACGRA